MNNKIILISWDTLMDYAATPEMWADVLSTMRVQLVGSLKQYPDYILAFMKLKGVDGPGEYIGQLWFDGMRWVLLNNSAENIMRLPEYPVIIPDDFAPEDVVAQIFPQPFSTLLRAALGPSADGRALNELCHRLWKEVPDDKKEDIIKLYQSHSHWSQSSTEDVTEDLQRERRIIMGEEDEVGTLGVE